MLHMASNSKYWLHHVILCAVHWEAKVFIFDTHTERERYARSDAMLEHRGRSHVHLACVIIEFAVWILSFLVLVPFLRECYDFISTQYCSIMFALFVEKSFLSIWLWSHSHASAQNCLFRCGFGSFYYDNRCVPFTLENVRAFGHSNRNICDGQKSFVCPNKSFCTKYPWTINSK